MNPQKLVEKVELFLRILQQSYFLEIHHELMLQTYNL